MFNSSVVRKFARKFACKFIWAALYCLGAWSAAPASYAQVKSVTVIAASQEASADNQLSAIREAIKESLRVNGFQEGKNFKLQFENIQANVAQIDAALLKLSRGRADAIVVISSEALAVDMTIPAQAAVVQVRLIESGAPSQSAGWTPSANGATGVSNTLTLARRIALIRQLLPGARKVGVIYNPADAKSVSRAKELQEQLTANGMVMIEAAAQRPADVGSAARSLISRVDVFYSLGDANVQKSYSALIKVANDAKVPLFGNDAENVRQGAVAALMVSDRDLGTQAGRMVARILRGAKSTAVAPEFAIRPQLYVNASAAQKQGVGLTETTLKSAVEVFNNVSQERTNNDRSRR